MCLHSLMQTFYFSRSLTNIFCCFPPDVALLKVPAEQFKLVLDSIVWAFKHTMRNVADTGRCSNQNWILSVYVSS